VSGGSERSVYGFCSHVWVMNWRLDELLVLCVLLSTGEWL